MVQVVNTKGTFIQLETTSDQTVKIVKADFTAGNIAVHVVNEVLLPAESFAIPCEYTVQPGDSLWGIALVSRQRFVGICVCAPRHCDPTAAICVVAARGKTRVD